MGKGACLQADHLNSVPRTHVAVGETGLQRVVVWPPHMCNGACVDAYTRGGGRERENERKKFK